jgi:peptide/nickel transport system substrate-binding protein
MWMNRRFTLYAAVVLMVTLALTGCAPVNQQSAAATDAPLIVLIDNDEGPITPANANTFIGGWMRGWIYDALLSIAPDLTLVPGLATEVTQSEDGLTWTIQLREGVTWHDGEPFTAEDVVFSYNFLYEAGRASTLSAMESIEAVGDYEVVIRLTSPQPFFPNESLAVYHIMPEHIWRDQEPISTELIQFQGKIGTGAYKLIDVVPGESYTFAANPDYFRGAPKVENVIAKIVKDRTQQFNQLRTGDASAVLSAVPPALVDEIGSSDEIEIATGPDFFSYVFYTNGSRPPFDNVDVRRAIAAAIDVEALIDTVLLGRGTALPLSFRHPQIPGAINIPHSYDPEQAKALLESAGLTDSNGDGIREFEGQETDFAILCDVNNPVEVRSTEIISEWLADVGIGSHQNCIDIDTSVSLIWPNFGAIPNPDYDLAIWGWSGVPQTRQGFIRRMVDGDLETYGGANLTGMSDPELDAITAEYVTSVDPARNEELNVQLQERFAEVLPFIPLMSPAGHFAYRPADYDGWVYVLGNGIMSVWSFLPEDAVTK